MIFSMFSQCRGGIDAGFFHDLKRDLLDRATGHIDLLDIQILEKAPAESDLLFDLGHFYNYKPCPLVYFYSYSCHCIFYSCG